MLHASSADYCLPVARCCSACVPWRPSNLWIGILQLSDLQALRLSAYLPLRAVLLRSSGERPAELDERQSV